MIKLSSQNVTVVEVSGSRPSREGFSRGRTSQDLGEHGERYGMKGHHLESQGMGSKKDQATSAVVVGIS